MNRLLKQFIEMKRVLQMIGQGGLPAMKGMKGMPKLPPMHAGMAARFAGAGQEAEEGRPVGADQDTVAIRAQAKSDRSVEEDRCYRFE